MISRALLVLVAALAIACRGEAPQPSPYIPSAWNPPKADSTPPTTAVASLDTASQAPDDKAVVDKEPADNNEPADEGQAAGRAQPSILVISIPRIDSLGARMEVELNLTSVAAMLDSLRSVLRPDSATTRGDSTFFRFHGQFQRSVVETIRPFNGREFQRIMYARIAELEYGVRSPLPASDGATADSVIAFFRDHAIHSYQGEGDAYFGPDEAVLLERFGALLTEPMREHLRLEILEQTHPLGGDGSVSVSWDELSNRLAATDKLLSNHPGFAARVTRTDRFRSYLGLYLAGGPNTPTFDHRSKVLLPEVRQSYERYVQKHGTLRTATMVRDYMALLATTGYRPLPPVVEFIKENSGFVISPAR